MRASRLTGAVVGTLGWALATDAAPLTLSHPWIVVTTGAPERKALEDAGFLYPDPGAPVLPASQAGAEKFRLKSRWRETGDSPLGIVFDRGPGPAEALPFATWKVSADWMDKGTFIEMLTPREMSKAVSLSISSHARTPERENEALARDPVKGAMFRHPNGGQRLTALRVVAPGQDRLPPAAAYLAERGLVRFTVGRQWLLDVTLDGAAQGVTRDLQPDLPMIVHY